MQMDSKIEGCCFDLIEFLRFSINYKEGEASMQVEPIIVMNSSIDGDRKIRIKFCPFCGEEVNKNAD